jgi:hypothetical protein
MVKRPSKKPKPADDEVEAAHDAVRLLTEQEGPTDAELRSQAASLLGKLGGRKGGLERARRLTKKQRAEIARQGAKARWKEHKKGNG